MIKSQYYLFLFVLIIGTMSSCLEKEEGCLNPNATNIDITADKNCCCTFPEIKMTVDFNWDTLDFKLTDTFVDQFNVPYKVNNFYVYLSNFELRNSNSGEIIKVIDSINNYKQLYFKDDLVDFSLGSTSYTIGEFDQSGEFDQLSFQYSYASDWNSVDTSTMEANHPWFEAALIRGDQRISWFMNAEMKKDTLLERNISYKTISTDRVTLLIDETVNSGEDMNIQVDFNVLKLFNGLDILGLSDDDLIEELNLRFKEAIR